MSCTDVAYNEYSFYGKLITELWSIICHMGSHMVTWHPTQANVPHLNFSQAGGQYTIYLPRMDGVGYILRWFTCLI